MAPATYLLDLSCYKPNEDLRILRDACKDVRVKCAHESVVSVSLSFLAAAGRAALSFASRAPAPRRRRALAERGGETHNSFRRPHLAHL